MTGRRLHHDSRQLRMFHIMIDMIKPGLAQPALEPDMTKSALALHLAVKKLCSQGVSFRRWVPFIYMGKV